MTFSRRRFLEACAASAAGAALLPRLTLAAAGPGQKFLRAGPAETMLLDPAAGDPMTRVWAYEGSVPGPLLRYRKGERAALRLVNGLEQPTSIHWHGVRIANAMDGVPGLTQEAAAPGAAFDYAFELPDAGTFWYHSHSRSWEQVARGLYGVLIVEEEEAPEVDQDIVLALDDWRIGDDGQIHEASFGALHDWAHAGRLGNWLTVNGRTVQEFPVTAGDRLRLRLLNAANARVLDLDLGPEEAALIALDGYPLEPRRLEGPLRLAPGQRADLIVDCTQAPGSRMSLMALNGEAGVEAAAFLYGAEDGRKRIEARPAARLQPWRAAPLELAGAIEQPLLMEGGAMSRFPGATLRGKAMDFRELASNGKLWAFNGVAQDMEDVGPPLLSARRGRSVVIDMRNETSFPHVMHLHGHHFQLLEVDGAPARHQDWRDGVLTQPGERVKIGFVADNPGKWLFHCHMLEHHAAGMGAWIEVLA
jgi:FtsP/CotA-like multicopper oxidase with cupredoxin domain